MRVNETRELFEQAFEYPVSQEAVVEEFGGVQIDAPSGDTASLASVFERCGTTTYDSLDDVYATLMSNLGEEFVGAKYYDDRGGTAGDPHPDSDRTGF